MLMASIFGNSGWACDLFGKDATKSGKQLMSEFAIWA